MPHQFNIVNTPRSAFSPGYLLIPTSNASLRGVVFARTLPTAIGLRKELT
ncbi:MAG: hypothetical protein RMY36_027905 [Nostoc sp. SerVER01]|nr:hypothetical protein [Nostoc sp. SerVER01]